MALTKEQLAVIRERAERATEGDWYWKRVDLIGQGVGPFDYAAVLESGHLPVLRHTAATWHIRPEDQRFIAHAREDIPALLDALEAAWGRAEKAEKDKAEIQANVERAVERDGLLILGWLRANLPEHARNPAHDNARSIVLSLKSERDGLKSALDAAWRDRDRMGPFASEAEARAALGGKTND